MSKQKIEILDENKAAQTNRDTRVVSKQFQQKFHELCPFAVYFVGSERFKSPEYKFVQ